MEIDITDFFMRACPRDYSASVAEIGANAGADTWSAAVDDAPDWDLLTSDDEREAFREFVRGFGVWTDEEISAWSDRELCALFIQFVSGDMREADISAKSTEDDWRRYQCDEESGRVSSRIYRADDGSIFFYL